MKHRIISALLSLLLLASCHSARDRKQTIGTTKTTAMETIDFKSGYSSVNGLQLYYEVYGQGKPLVLLHGGGSTIQTTFGRILSLLAKNRQVIAVELQAHGHTGDRNTALSFEQDADDVAALLKNLKIDRADLFGFSNGGTTALQVAIRHPELAGRIIAASALCQRSGVPPEFWGFMENATPEQMPQQYKDAYTAVAPVPGNLKTMGDKCARRMVEFRDITDAQLQAIKSPTLFIIGDTDVITPEHAVAMHRLIPDSRLAIIPGGHGEYLGEITTLQEGAKDSDYTVALIETFLDTPDGPKD